MIMMTKSYQIAGMTCKACAQIVHDSIATVKGVTKVNVDLSKAQASIEMEHPIPLKTLQVALADSLYQISEFAATSPEQQTSMPPDDVSERNIALISSYLMAVGRLDYELLRRCLRADFRYHGPASYHSANDYIEMIKEHANSPVADVLVKNEIKAIFADGNECCAIYDVVSRFPGKKVSLEEWIKIEDGKIASTDVKYSRHQMKQLMQEMGNAKRPE
jgi:copper chaperone CopZ